jgi:hypothetical protein
MAREGLRELRVRSNWVAMRGVLQHWGTPAPRKLLDYLSEHFFHRPD